MVSYHLFLKPGCEINEGTEIEQDNLLQLADYLKNRLEIAAFFVSQLSSVGFIPYMGKYEVCFDHKKVDSEPEAKKLISSIGIDPDDFEYSF